MLESISRVKRRPRCQLLRAVPAWVPWSAPKPVCVVMTGRRMAPWQRLALHQPTVLLSPFSRMTLLKHQEHMSDRHRKTCSDNEAVISKHVPWQRPALGVCTTVNSGCLHSLRHCLLSWTGSTNLTFTRLACLQERGAHPDDFTWSLCGLLVDTVPKCLRWIQRKLLLFYSCCFFFLWLGRSQNWQNAFKVLCSMSTLATPMLKKIMSKRRAEAAKLSSFFVYDRLSIKEHK